ncbi:MAG: FUSC family protein [Burkholderiales bacterium]|nr:FUSC family protein [Burkholderiales bacterium]
MSTLILERDFPAMAQAWAWLRRELAPFPGRTDAVWRYVLSSAIVILISMTLRVPSLALSLILVFFTAQDNTVFTRKSATVLLLGATLAVTSSLLLIKFTMDFPLMRILCASAIVFVGMYFMRISKLGSIGYLVALFVIDLQSLVDVINNPEALTRAILWVWVAMVYPIVVTVIVNQLLLPAHPGRLLTDELLRQLDEVDAQLAARAAGTAIPQLSLDAIERGVLTLHRYLTFATMGDARYQTDKARHLTRIATVDRLHTAAVQLSRLPAEAATPAQLSRLGQLQIASSVLRQSIEHMQQFSMPADTQGERAVEGAFDTALREMALAMQALAEAESMARTDIPVVKDSLIAPDAFSNLVYAQFALKTLLAALLCYVFYTATQWQGIHTSMLTCIIMALPSLGATSHKGLQRIVGCALGSIVALWASVFVIPHLDSITGLLMLTLPTIAVGAWIAAGSARINYVGVQFVFAFALALLGRFEPMTDLTEIRDRLLGILIGIGVSIFVFTFVWPERESGELRTMLGRLLRSIANLARTGHDAAPDAVRRGQIDKARTQSWSLFAQNRDMQARVALEPGWQYARDTVTVRSQTWLANAQEALFAVNWLQTVLQHIHGRLPGEVEEAVQAFGSDVAQTLDQLAASLEAHAPVSMAALNASVSRLAQTCFDARGQGGDTTLLDDVENAAHSAYEHLSLLARLAETGQS